MHSSIFVSKDISGVCSMGAIEFQVGNLWSHEHWEQVQPPFKIWQVLSNQVEEELHVELSERICGEILVERKPNIVRQFHLREHLNVVFASDVENLFAFLQIVFDIWKINRQLECVIRVFHCDFWKSFSIRILLFAYLALKLYVTLALSWGI